MAVVLKNGQYGRDQYGLLHEGSCRINLTLTCQSPLIVKGNARCNIQCKSFELYSCIMVVNTVRFILFWSCASVILKNFGEMLFVSGRKIVWCLQVPMVWVTKMCTFFFFYFFLCYTSIPWVFILTFQKGLSSWLLSLTHHSAHLRI